MSSTKLVKLNQSLNIAKDLDKKQLSEIASHVIDEFKLDKLSRAEWEKTMNNAMKMAKQVLEIKNHPWENASNIKFPLIAGSCIQYAARTYPEIVKNDRVVHARVSDPLSIPGSSPPQQEQAEEQAEAIAKHMSYQLLIASDEWEDSTDRLLHMQALLGTVFKKVYYDPIQMRNVSELCSPEDVFINHNITSLSQARRISHRIYLHTNEIISGINLGIYSDIDVRTLTENITGAAKSSNSFMQGTNNTNPSANDDPDKLHEFIEQHRFLDLDGDGYQEPYIVTVHTHTQKVLRIVARWDLGTEKTQSTPGEGFKVIYIPPVDYFIDYHFIPSPDGKFYSMGFGSLLFTINDSINSIFNQLIDSGTLSNQQSGIIAKGARIKGGNLRMTMGEFTKVDTVPGAALKDSIVPFPFKEPSQTLFHLLGLLIQAGKDLSSVTDIMTGQEQAQNVPATTIMTLAKNGLVVFTGIQKRLHRALKKEFEALFRLNSLYEDDPTVRALYKTEAISVHPVSDPNLSSDVLRLARVQAILQTVTTIPAAGGGLQEALTLFYKELQVPDEIMAKLLKAPPPDPSLIKIQVDAQRDHVDSQVKAMSAQADVTHRSQELALKHKEVNMQALESAAKVEQMRAQSILDLAQAKQADEQFKINAYLQILSSIDVNKGISAATVQPALDSLLSTFDKGGAPQQSQQQPSQAPDVMQQAPDAQDVEDNQPEPEPEGGQGEDTNQ